MSRGDALVKTFEGYRPNPSLRDLVGQESEIPSPRTEAEDQCTALMPGDVEENHPLHTPPNPYLGAPYSELRGLLRRGVSSRAEERLIRQALDMQQRQHSDGVPGRPASTGDFTDPPSRRQY